MDINTRTNIVDRRRREYFSKSWWLAVATAALVVVAIETSEARAGSIWLSGTDGINNVPTRSLQEQKFSEVVRQKYDFSCGSAALATLLKFHYDHDTDEQAAFGAMYAAGDKEKIAAAGFSLLDMKRYLESIGYQADGYQASLDTLAEAGVPAIALINHRGYRHFVVIKGIQNGEVLIGDPALGLKFQSRIDFESVWDNGVLFIIKNKPVIGQKHFNEERVWRGLAKAPLESALSSESLASLTVNLPRIGDF